jgi:hypothetical protein
MEISAQIPLMTQHGQEWKTVFAPDGSTPVLTRTYD